MAISSKQKQFIQIWIEQLEEGIRPYISDVCGKADVSRRAYYNWIESAEFVEELSFQINKAIGISVGSEVASKMAVGDLDDNNLVKLYQALIPKEMKAHVDIVDYEKALSGHFKKDE